MPNSTSTTRPPTRVSSSTRRPPSRATSAATISGGEGDGEWVLAILEGRGAGREVGVVAIEKDLGKVIMTQYGDSATFVKTLHLCTTRPPSIILVPQSSLTGSASSKRGRVGRFSSEIDDDAGAQAATGSAGEPTLLVKSLRDTFKTVQITGVVRKYWEEQARFEFIAQLILNDDKRTGTILSIKPKYYALAAASALFNYLETSHSLIFPPHSLRIEYAPLEGTCMIDTETAKNLELVSNLLNKNSKQHLLGLMNKCYTPMATRLLRTNLLSPLTDVTVIDTRLDAVEELVNSEERLSAVRRALEPLKSLDTDKLVGQIVQPRDKNNPLSTSLSASANADPSKMAEQKITRLLSLRKLLVALPALRNALHNTDSTLLKTVSRILHDERAEVMLEAIAATINEEALASNGPTSKGKGALAGRNGKIYAVRAERKLLLDVARETYKENLNDAFDLCDELKKEHGLEGMTLLYSNGGFVFSCSSAEWDEHASEVTRAFVNVHKKGKKVEFSSMDLKKKNARITESVQEIFIMSDKILDELFDEIRVAIACLYRCSEAIAMLDMLAAFADISSKNNYVRPEWTDTLAIKAGRHPLHEHFRAADGAFVPNDTYASDDASFQIITGANMSGKSTLLRQISLMQIMAQAGCYVPATYASFRVVEALLSRLGNDDSIEASLSTFAQEMSTMSMICGALSTIKQSLVIVDELGRGTSPEEGVGIAHALAEEIIKAGALCFFATHFKGLTLTLSRFPNVVSLHLVTDIDRSQSDFSLTFHHRVVDGSTPLTHYGLELAKMAKLPSDLIERASDVSMQLSTLAEAGKRQSKGSKVATRRKVLLRLRKALQDLHASPSLAGFELMSQLRELQHDAVKTLTETMVTPEEVSARIVEEVDDSAEEADGPAELAATDADGPQEDEEMLAVD